MHPIFGRVEAEWSAPPTSSAPFLYHVHGIGDDRSALRVIASDFQSNTFQAIRSRQQLDDLVRHPSASLDHFILFNQIISPLFDIQILLSFSRVFIPITQVMMLYS